MPKKFTNKEIDALDIITYPGIEDDSVFTFCIADGAAAIVGYHLNNPNPVTITADIAAEEVPGIVLAYGTGFSRFEITPTGTVNRTVHAGKS